MIMNSTLEYVLRKFEIDASQTQPILIERINRNDLSTLFAELGFTKGAEIGVDRGTFSEILCQNNPNLKLFSIDSWSTNSFENPQNKTNEMQKKFDTHYEDAKRRLSKYNCKIIKKESLSAVKDFTDGSLDFVYIDANHSFAEIAMDLFKWERKVRHGGIVSGHDYEHFYVGKDNHVKHIVDAYVQAFEITPYFELEQDKYHSWFWVKE